MIEFPIPIEGATIVTAQDTTLNTVEELEIGIFQVAPGASVIPGSFSNDTLDCHESQVATGGDFRLGNPAKIQNLNSSATASFNPSFVDIGGALVLGFDATLRLRIEGLIRSSATALADYSAPSTPATPRSMAFLNSTSLFPACRQTTSFELIRLAPGGVFTGNFDSVMASGLPSGLSVVLEFFGQSLNARVIGMGPLQLNPAVSRKNHGGTEFDIDLPLTGSPGIECRIGPAHTLVLTFTNPIVSGAASVTGGMGSVSGSPTFAGNTMTVNLTGVTDIQTLTVTLANVTDSFSQVLPNTTVDVNFLLGDVSGNNSVNATDISQVKSQSGVAVSTANFRNDLNANGNINATDISQAKANSGNMLSAATRKKALRC